MLEVYVALTLVGVGMILNKYTPKKIPPGKQDAQTITQKPTMKNIYNNNATKENVAIEATQIKKHNNQIVNQLSGQQQPRQQQPHQQQPHHKKQIVSELTGLGTDMKHSNMLPFLRGSVTQNVNDTANVSIMENFGTRNDTSFRKKEVVGLFVPEANIKTGPSVENFDDLMYRMPKPFSQKNVLPFEQQRVGRGIDQGYTTKPTGGFQQTNLLEKIMPKNVDQLRTANNPKFGGVEGRIVEGQKGRNRGIAGTMEKRLPEKTFAQCHDQLIKTTGAVLKAKQQPVIVNKDTSRQVTSAVSYSGVPYNKRKGNEQRSEVQESNRKILATMSPANIIGNKRVNDFGKDSVLVYTNERDITSTKTYKGNIQSLVKSIVTPIQDMIRVTKKEDFVNSGTREYGELQPQIPSKQTVYDPNNVARTTIKETTIHDSENLNIKGSLKLTVYDPADVARTTVRQTVNQQSENMNMSSHVYKSVTFDPNAVARTTIKETLLQDTDPANLKTIEQRGIAHQPGEKTRDTIRQTLEQGETTLNMSAVNVHMSKVHDPDDIARVTMKETTVDANEDRRGAVSGIKFDAAYIDAVENLDIKGTQKDSYTDIDYYGTAQIGFGGDAYKDANFDAKITMKQDPVEYYGTAADQTTHVPMSQEGAQAQTYNGLKESVLVERSPTTSGQKTGYGKENVNMDIKKQILENNLHIMPSVQNKNLENDRGINLTKSKQCSNQQNRLDMEILEPFKTNPYTQSLNSAPSMHS